MSVTIDVLETISVMKFQDQDYNFERVLSIIRNQYSTLFVQASESRARIAMLKLTLNNDESKATYISSIEDWLEISSKFEEAQALTISADYYYSTGYNYEVPTGPGRLLDFLAYQEDDFYINFYYSLYYRYDSAGTDQEMQGTMELYGKRNGRIHKGPLSLRALKDLPQKLDGDWFTLGVNTLFLELVPTPTELDFIMDRVKVLEKYGLSGSLVGEELDYYFPEIMVKNREDILAMTEEIAGIHKFLIAKGERFRDGLDGYIHNLLDISLGYPRLLEIKIHSDGTSSYAMMDPLGV